MALARVSGTSSTREGGFRYGDSDRAPHGWRTSLKQGGCWPTQRYQVHLGTLVLVVEPGAVRKRGKVGTNLDTDLPVWCLSAAERDGW